MKINNQIFEIKQKNLEQLIKLSFDKSKNSCFISFKDSLKEKIFDKMIKHFNECNNRNNNSFQNISNIKTNNDFEKEEQMITFISNNINQIILEYIGNQNSNEINNNINLNINNLFNNLCNNDEINFLIKYFQTDFQNNYYQKRDIIMLKYKIYLHEINFSLNNNTLQKTE